MWSGSGGLDALIPNSLNRALDGGVTRNGLARAVAAYTHEGNTIHDMAGTRRCGTIHYGPMGTPKRIYRDGRRIQADVFQRIINDNFALQLRRAPMLANYGHLALDPKGAALFTQF